MNIPNLLTFIRILLVPIFVVVFYLPYQWSYLAAAIIFASASITDWLDGYLARKLNQTTPFGAFLDPVADKIIVAVALVLLVESHASSWLAIPALVIISREIMVSALREWMAEIGKQANVTVSYVGKVKTALQMIAIIVLLANKPDFDSTLVIIGYGLLYLAVLLTLWSMIIYMKAAWPNISDLSN